MKNSKTEKGLPLGDLTMTMLAVARRASSNMLRSASRRASCGRGFAPGEFRARVARAREAMAAAEVDALWCSSEADVRYFTGVDSEFWYSPTRPVFVVVPREGPVVAVAPEIWAPAFDAAAVDELRTWPAPREADDGVSLVVEALAGVPRTFGAIALPMGLESAPRAPVATVDGVRAALAAEGVRYEDASPLLRALRARKSPAEVRKLEAVAAMGSAGFAALPGRLEALYERNGFVTERDAQREMRLALLEAGADAVPYVAATAGAPSYASVVAAPRDAALERGSVLCVDAGARWDGYHCDFNRNFAVGALDPAVAAAHDALWAATDAAVAAAAPGAAVGDVGAALAVAGAPPGRSGHFLGLELTELPSVAAGERTALEVGHALCLEPGAAVGGGAILVHEETIVVEAGGARLLSDRAPRTMASLAVAGPALDDALAAAEGWAVRAAKNPRLRDEGRGPFFAGAELEALLAAQGAARTRVEGWANYEPSRVVDMPAVARALGVARVVAKDESDRFGTGSFKALGGALVVDELRETRADLSVATASAGNHGLGVAWGARNAGAEAVVYLGNQVSEAMADRMRALGAAVVRAGDSYEASVAKCKADAAERGHVIIQDVGVPGVYEDIPRTIHAGYGVVAAELLEQCAPTHVLVNAGVGGFAAGVANTVLATKAAAGEAPPRLVTVEPAEADCLRRLATGDPEPTPRGPTVQTGLDCHEVCPLAWSTLETTVANFLAVPDAAVEPAKALLRAYGVDAGESAVASLAALLKAAKDPALKADLGLDADSVVAFVVCEGPPGRAD